MLRKDSRQAIKIRKQMTRDRVRDEKAIKISTFSEALTYCKEGTTTISTEIKILGEIEKIWILHDHDSDGILNLSEITDYLLASGFPGYDLTNN